MFAGQGRARVIGLELGPHRAIDLGNGNYRRPYGPCGVRFPKLGRVKTHFH
jgi:hypothetical protein